MKPLMAPHAALIRMTTSAAPDKPSGSAMLALTHAPSAKTAPTDRSNPPPIITKVMPTATMPIGAFWLMILVMFETETSRG